MQRGERGECVERPAEEEQEDFSVAAQVGMRGQDGDQWTGPLVIKKIAKGIGPEGGNPHRQLHQRAETPTGSYINGTPCRRAKQVCGLENSTGSGTRSGKNTNSYID
ncbi:hypothetical protein MMC31_006357, partial [Peltigera leucophlebia]|nr:hypothetical protein [Peltigera leucophlebia]